jgi:hypothetical protein
MAGGRKVHSCRAWTTAYPSRSYPMLSIVCWINGCAGRFGRKRLTRSGAGS